MLSCHQVYPAVPAALQALAVGDHRTAQTTLARLVAALVCGQSLRPAYTLCARLRRRRMGGSMHP